MKHRKKIGLAGAAVLVGALSGFTQPSHAIQRFSQHITKHASANTTPLTIVPGPNGDFQNNFNPFSPAANYGTIGLIYQPLFYFDNISGKTFPLLGTSFSWTNANRTLTVHLRDAKWSNGSAFTSSDVVFTFDLLKKYPAADANGVWSQLSSVQSRGPHEVVFQFKKANVPFASYVLEQFIVPQRVWAKLGDPTKVGAMQPMGSGPYILSSFNAQDYKFYSNLQYWGGPPVVRNLEFPAYSGNQSADLALATGQIAWAGIFIPSIQSIYASKSPHNKYWFPPSNVVMLYTNLKDPLLSQLPVRQAMSLAINRNQLYLQGEYGYEPPASPTGLVLPNNKAWVDHSLPKQDLTFSYNPAKAVQILEKAGFKKNAQGIFTKNGKELSFTLQVVSGWTDWDTDCALIANELGKIGIKVTVQEEQFGAYFSNINSAKKNYQLAISWTNTGPSPYFLYQNMLNSQGSFNVEQLRNATVNHALQMFSETSSSVVQHQAIDMLEKYMAEQLPSIPLVYGATWNEYNDTNFTGWPTQSHPYVNPAPFNPISVGIVLTHLKPVN
ncbi:ABC transporter substrate-binding protein [Ferroacidibacillus organovorans]|uniref:Solute-binding protein family 5 domain-containing protein n=1 Tax=Ferroacidibacillus organovorans TaxID=1765683 RepID=A0A117SXM7_9BACL|nr:ABC transporter substrate-binding protein [Ferroacidibacillus organovorans]KUO95509.1 hypothetical protein ATW55_09480 [Ferroacidibacillus organovorans]